MAADVKRHILMALTRPVEGREQEFRDWYINTHLPEVLQVPYYMSAQLFERSSEYNGESRPYLAVYEVETDDIAKARVALETSRKSGEMFISESLDWSGNIAAFYTPISGNLVAKANK